jgi:hypothetical protein
MAYDHHRDALVVVDVHIGEYVAGHVGLEEKRLFFEVV